MQMNDGPKASLWKLSWQLHKSSAAQSYSSLLAALYINPCLPRLHLQEMLPGDVHMPGEHTVSDATGTLLPDKKIGCRMPMAPSSSLMLFPTD